METRFENRYFCDKKLLREFARKYSVGPTPLTTAITTPIVVLCLPVLVKGALDGMELSVIPVAYLVLILIQFLPRLYAWSISGTQRSRMTASCRRHGWYFPMKISRCSRAWSI